jgi:hypothetical protein
MARMLAQVKTSTPSQMHRLAIARLSRMQQRMSGDEQVSPCMLCARLHVYMHKFEASVAALLLVWMWHV